MAKDFASQQQATTQNKNKFIKIIIPIVIIVMAFVIFIVMKSFASIPEKKSVENKAPLVNIEPIHTEAVALKVSSQGTVNPLMETTLTAEISGRVVEVSPKFNNGGFFSKNDTILKINDIDYQIAMLQSKARLEVAKAALLEENARVKQAEDEWRLSGKPLSKAPILALRKPQLQKAEADVALAEAELESAKIKLARTIIKAPYDGIIKGKQVDLGQFVNTGTALAEIFSIAQAEIRLPIKSEDIAFINLPKVNETQAQAPVIELTTVINNEKTSWHASLTRYEGEIDRQNRVHYVVATVDDPYNLQQIEGKQELRMGSFVNALIAGKQLQNITILPRNAVVGRNTLHLINNDNELLIHTFNTLHSDDNYIYTQDSFPVETNLILTELLLPVQGMKLRVSEPTDTLAKEAE